MNLRLDLFVISVLGLILGSLLIVRLYSQILRRRHKESTMPPIPEAALKNILITGPLWSAEVEVLKATDGQDWAFRTLFLDHTPRLFRGQSEIFLPGTMLLLCFVRRVVVHPNGPDDSATRYVWQRLQTQPAPTDLTPDALKTDLG
ncbi:MAG: hypothetical protein F6K42_24025, partial [Leptolyngbya sp. SIO1D8]|nr:hypothetical protein [Leptolyngbya sp. SIO1D8]